MRESSQNVVRIHMVCLGSPPYDLLLIFSFSVVSILYKAKLLKNKEN